MTTFAIFKSRSRALAFSQRLSSYGVRSVLVPTPREVGIGCGLSVCFDTRYLAKARAVAALQFDSSFKGFYAYGYRGGKPTLLPVFK